MACDVSPVAMFYIQFYQEYQHLRTFIKNLGTFQLLEVKGLPGLTFSGGRGQMKRREGPSSCWLSQEALIVLFLDPNFFANVLVFDQLQIFGYVDICCIYPLSFGGSIHFCCGNRFTLTDRAWLWSIRNALCSTVPYTLWLFCTYILLKMLNNTLQ